MIDPSVPSSTFVDLLPPRYEALWPTPTCIIPTARLRCLVKTPPIPIKWHIRYLRKAILPLEFLPALHLPSPVLRTEFLPLINNGPPMALPRQHSSLCNNHRHNSHTKPIRKLRVVPLWTPEWLG